MNEMKTLPLAFTYVGVFLGAGFVSGPELWAVLRGLRQLGLCGFSAGGGAVYPVRYFAGAADAGGPHR